MAKYYMLHIHFSTSPNLCNHTTLLNTDVQNCYITLEFITIRLRGRHPSVERLPYSEEGTAAQVPKEEQCQELTADNKHARMTRARQLLNKYPNLTVNLVFFTDEKLFTVAAATNSQNQKEEPQQKPTSSNEIDIQQVSRWTLNRWMILFSVVLLWLEQSYRLHCVKLTVFTASETVEDAFV